MTLLEFLISLAKVVTIPVIVLSSVPVLIWMERKGAAYFQDRRGPNRANIFGIRLGGMIHNIADVIKLMTKEEFFPAGANRFYFVVAPLIVLFIYVVTIAVVPFGDNLTIGDLTVSLRIADLNVGVLYIFAMASLAVYGIMLAGWSSNNKYSLLGALRASSQMVSYEIALGLSVVSLFLLTESVDLNDIVRHQGPSILSWNFLTQPVAFLIFLVAAFAETNRTPFDLPEGESELVAGFHVEYSSMKFALFFMGEYAAIVVSSALIVSLFFGGWQVPFLSTQGLIDGAPFFLRLIGLGGGVLSLLFGLFLLTRFRRGRYKDARDFEVVVLGLPLLIVGGGLLWFLLSGRLPPLPPWGGAVFAAALQVAIFLAKVFCCCFFFVWVRWTLPRFRYDQLMSFGWKGLLPLALFNLMATATCLLFTA